VDNVADVDKREIIRNEPADKTIKVTETNRKRINTLAGELAKDGDSHSQNEAVSYLFTCLDKLKQLERKEKQDGS